MARRASLAMPLTRETYSHSIQKYIRKPRPKARFLREFDLRARGKLGAGFRPQISYFAMIEAGVPRSKRSAGRIPQKTVMPKRTSTVAPPSQKG